MRPMNGSWCPSTTQQQQQQQHQLHHCLKINKDSHTIKKPSSNSTTSSSSSSSSYGNRAAAFSPPPMKPQQRHPVIIYTHSPKVIHTHPKDFMALVQKLTGMSCTDQENNKNNNNNNRSDYMKVEENESLSGITTSEDNVGDNTQVNSNCLGPPHMAFHQPHNSFTGLPLYPAGAGHNNNNNNDLLCCNSSTTDPTTYDDFIDFNVPFK